MATLVSLFVVDANSTITRSFDFLSSKGHNIITVSSLDEIIAELETPDQMVASVTLSIPENQTEFEGRIRTIKRQEKAKYIPFIGVLKSGCHADEVCRQPFFHILEEPIDENILLHTIEAAQSDFKRYNALLKEVSSRTSAIGLIKSGSFRLQTLGQAEALTTMLSLACPEPSVVALGLSELLVNAIEHGNLQINYQLKSQLLESGQWEKEITSRLASNTYKDKYVEVVFERLSDRIEITVTDQGDGFDWRKFIECDPSLSTDKHGRGIAIAIAMGFNKLTYNDKGNQVIATINL
ncbi:ATP-binding protein [Terasakiella pusilla]|jgi:anti-sigma regulatory factor (Ser/Thr protein kinase)|uniref:ATP-binding protein n=1 Tax=Terasakiella pusilla TaxID=64973 RepID=UPI00068B9492|nr:ATP-binding protein [Terasakiella pusilla]